MSSFWRPGDIGVRWGRGRAGDGSHGSGFKRQEFPWIRALNEGNFCGLHLMVKVMIYSLFYLPVIRTAQGGGGSFKDRKLIGEVSCCDE